jgi:ABC-type multidrug transport system fused ATPase/permease subunit
VLSGLRPQLSGVVTSEGRVLSSKDLLASCAYVDQHPYLFSGSLRENLTIGTDVTDGEILAAADLVDMADFLKSRGLDTNIADRGTNVSQGQRYRLALIRAILTRKTFLLLDEPFAALDSTTAEHLARSLAKLKLRHAIVVVTHYVPTGFHFDQMINFDRPMTTNRAASVASCEQREDVVPPSKKDSVGTRVEH